jgi:hypothetical protein
MAQLLLCYVLKLSVILTFSCKPHLSASQPNDSLISVFGRGRGGQSDLSSRTKLIGEQIRDGDDERVEEERGGAGRPAPRHALPVARAGRRGPDARPGAHPPRPSLAHPPIVCISPSSYLLACFSGLVSDYRNSSDMISYF